MSFQIALWVTALVLVLELSYEQLFVLQGRSILHEYYYSDTELIVGETTEFLSPQDQAVVLASQIKQELADAAVRDAQRIAERPPVDPLVNKPCNYPISIKILGSTNNDGRSWAEANYD